MSGVFVSGVHVAFLRAMLLVVEHHFDFCGTGVSRMWPGCGKPSLALLPKVSARFTFVFASANTLMPVEDQEAIAAAQRKADLPR